MTIRYLILALTTHCNLACAYCYAGDLKQHEDMAPEIIQQALSFAGCDDEPFHLQLTGGEPTLVPNLIETAAKTAEAAGNCSGMAIQTNATCLNEALLEMLQHYDVQVGVSIDGPPDIQNAMRGRAAQTLQGLQILEAAKIPFNVTTVVTQANAAYLDQLVLMLAGFSMVRGIGLDLLVTKGRAKHSSNALPVESHILEDGIRRMLAVLDTVNARRSIPIRLREQDRLYTSKSTKLSPFCHACSGQSMAVLPDGRIFPCSQTLGDPRFSAGTVWQPEEKNLFIQNRMKAPDLSCQICPIRHHCPGECPSRRHYNGDRHADLACDLYRAVWQYKNRR